VYIPSLSTHNAYYSSSYPIHVDQSCTLYHVPTILFILLFSFVILGGAKSHCVFQYFTSSSFYRTKYLRSSTLDRQEWEGKGWMTLTGHLHCVVALGLDDFLLIESPFLIWHRGRGEERRACELLQSVTWFFSRNESGVARVRRGKKGKGEEEKEGSSSFNQIEANLFFLLCHVCLQSQFLFFGDIRDLHNPTPLSLER